LSVAICDTIAADFARFAAARGFGGDMVARGQSGFDRRIAIDNGARTAMPAIAVSPCSVGDVAVALSIATRHGWPVSIKGGGHGAAGFCLVEGGVTIDMHRLDQVAISPSGDRVWVGAGVTWIDAYAAVAAFDESVTLVGGACADVGVAGFLLGGGYSFLSRKFGLGCDQVRSLEMVLADGSKVTATQDNNSDLFWACRGGGGGNFGVVTGFELSTVRPDYAKLAFVECSFAEDDIAPLLEQYHGWATTLSTDIAAYGRWFAKGAFGSGQRIQLTCVGDCPPQEIVGRLEPLLNLGGIVVDVQQSTMHGFSASLGGRTKLGGKQALIRSGFVQNGDAWPAIGTVLARAMERAPTADSLIIWTHAGGRIADIPPDETAFAHRFADYLLELKAPWHRPDQRIEVKQWADTMFEGLRPHISGSYVNYADPDLLDWEHSYYGSNTGRLRRIKADHDPHGVFRFEQSIGGDGS
jgi:FAD/FMN-containing dehydrogenase